MSLALSVQVKVIDSSYIACHSVVQLQHYQRVRSENYFELHTLKIYLTCRKHFIFSKQT